MDPATIGAIAIIALILLLLARVPIGFSLLGVATLSAFVIYAWAPGTEFHFDRGFFPTLALLKNSAFGFIHSYELSMIPLFIAAGHIAYRTRITTDIYEAIRVWFARVPGGLAMATITGCGGFSAITGSSLACAAAMGRICVPEMLNRGYSNALATSSVAVGGTLGSLIPPSILFVIYGIFAETSISALFLAGVIPGLLSLAGFILSAVIWAKLRPQDAPRQETGSDWRENFRALRLAVPALVLMVVIVGGIYTGLATATEAAAICFVFIIAHGFLTGRLNFGGLSESLRTTVIQSAGLFFISAGAKTFVAFISLTGLTQDLVALITSHGLSDVSILAAIIVIYLILGMFLDPIGAMLLTLPFVIPLVDDMGLNLIWFGVVVVKLLEIGLVTPPVGLNVFVINSVVGDKVRIGEIFRGVLRFLAVDLLVLGLIIFIPALSLFLPGTMR